MNMLIIILIIILIFSLILNYISFSSKKTVIQIIDEMGIGYNLGYSFDSYISHKEINNPDEQITLLGNTIPTKQIIHNIKRNGFKTIRFPITWLYFMDESGNINLEWMSRVKEVVDWIISYNMYCIINVYNDAKSGNWLSEGLNVKEKYIKLWEQISNEFKDYNEFLIFESMNKPNYRTESIYNYTILFTLNQIFIDIVRNSGGMNSDRLLLISGANSDLDLTCNLNYKIPNDPASRLAISINYYLPNIFTNVTSFYEVYNEYGEIVDTILYSTWGDENDYNEIIFNFDTINNYFVSKGIPVVLSEVGVLTEDGKEINSIREYLYVVFAISADTSGIMSCLWDTSNKAQGNMNYYMRNNNSWYDETIKNIFMKISKGRNVKSSEYYLMTNFENIKQKADIFNNLNIKIGNRKVYNIIVNINFYDILYDDYYFSIFSFDKNGEWFEIIVGKKHRKKQYDGTTIFKINLRDLDCNDSLEIYTIYDKDNLIYNYITLEFEEISFDF